MLSSSARLLRLLSLLQSRRDWGGGELADRLGVTPRTVRRDVGRLRDLGYPVLASPGTAGGYRLGAGAALPPLLLDDDEAVAVAIGLRVQTGGVTGIEETSLRALAKLEQVLPARLRHRVNALQSATVPLAGGGTGVDPGLLSRIAGACRAQERLLFAYRSHDGTATRRTVEPHRLVATGRRWYLLAWDVTRRDWRTFRVDRIEGETATGTRFSARELSDEEAADRVRRAIASAPYTHQARVRLHAPAAAVRDRVSAGSGMVETVDDATCVLTAGGGDLGWMAVWLATFGVDFEVLDPPELQAEVRVLAGRMDRAARAFG